MRQTIIILLLALFAVSGWAQDYGDGFITFENMGLNNDVLPQLKVEEGYTIVKMNVQNYKGNGGEEVCIIPRICTEYSSLNIVRDKVSAEGTATIKLKVPYTAPAYISYNGKICGENVIIAPGETLEMLIDDTKEEGSIVVGCKGYLARTNVELCNKSTFDLRKPIESWADSFRARILDCYENGQPHDILDIFEEWYEDRLKETKARNNSDVVKSLWQCKMDAQYISFLCDYGSMLEYWIEKREFNNDRTALSTKEFQDRYKELYDRSDIIHRVKEKNMQSLTNGTMPLMYSHFTMDRYLGKSAYDEIFTDDLIHDYAITWEVEGQEKLNDIDLSRYRREDFRNIMVRKVQERIDATTTKTATENNGGVYFATHDDVAPENILQTILDKYKGKIVVIDLWETWCQPCHQAHKQMADVKSELTGKDIVFVYIASSKSDVEKWKEMITNISGEHYCITKSQSDFLMKSYNSNGIPTFAIYDTEGKFVESYIGSTATTAIREKLLEITE